MAGFVFNRGARDLQNNTIVWASDTIKARLFLTSGTPDKDTTTMTGIGVTGNDVTLASKTFTEDTANDRIVYDAADFTFTAQAAGSEVSRVVIFKFVTNDAGSTPIAILDITPVTPNGGDITITISANGLFYTQQ